VSGPVPDDRSARLAVVTGAASGIGAAVSARFAANGWDVLRLDRATGPGVVAADVTDPDSLAAAADALGGRPVGALVPAAGVWLEGDHRYSKVDLDVWETTWRVNVTGTMLTLRAFAPLLASGAGVVTVGSLAALAGIPRRDAYTASKGAVVALTRAWAADLIRQGVRVNCVAPGVVATPMTERTAGEDLDLPLGRAATPDEIAEVIVGAATAGYLNGAVIPIDGGVTAAARWSPIAPR
jgi:NAD(P)-dependent dehydrogenase (short-subunit alcohol dehydrogenase family)